jgi:hypothetical protein
LTSADFITTLLTPRSTLDLSCVLNCFLHSESVGLPTSRMLALCAIHAAECSRPAERAGHLASFVDLLIDPACALTGASPPLDSSKASSISNAIYTLETSRPPDAFMPHLLSRDAAVATLRHIIAWRASSTHAIAFPVVHPLLPAASSFSTFKLYSPMATPSTCSKGSVLVTVPSSPSVLRPVLWPSPTSTTPSVPCSLVSALHL